MTDIALLLLLDLSRWQREAIANVVDKMPITKP